MRLALVCFYCLCVFVYVLYFIATMSFAGYFLSVLLCMLSMLISDSRFDLVWFRLSCDHGWIRSGSVNVRKQQQQQLTVKLSGLPDLSVASICGPRVSRGVRAFKPHQCGSFRVHFPGGPSRVPSRQRSPALALVLHLPVTCGSRTPGLEFRCRIVSCEKGYCVSWVPFGVERVACMTAAYLKTLALICLTKLFW